MPYPKDDTSRKNVVLINGVVLREIKKQCPVKNLKRLTGLSPEKWRTLMREVKQYGCGALTVTKFAELCVKTGRRPEDVRHLDALPDVPDFYTSLTHSYYVSDQGTPVDFEPRWRPESIRFELHRPRDPSNGNGRLGFRVRLTNADGVAMRGVAARNNPSHFVLSVGGCNEKNIAFDAVFARVYDGVLCGIWIGIDSASVQTVYRMVLSRGPLTAVQLRAIANRVRVNCVLSGDTGELDKHTVS